MEKAQIDILARNSGKTVRTVFRALNDLGLSKNKTLSDVLTNMVVIYLRIEGEHQGELRRTLKIQIEKLSLPVQRESFDNDFKKYLLEQSKQKDRQLKKKEKQINKYTEAIVGLSNKLLVLVDDISMLRVQDTGTIQRLHDKNVLADLLLDLEPG
ncbi:MAG: hypothetical protein WBB27_17765, partial [Maribacter sp.]